MPLVPKMIRELVFALPPLGEARVLDLLCRKSDFFKIKCIFRNISWQWSVQCGRQKGLSEVSADHSGQKSVQIGAVQTTVRGSGHQLYSGIRVQY